MGKNIVQKIFAVHKVYGELTPGAQIGLKVDQVLTQDATGTMTWLEFEAIGIDRVQVETAVSYVDHNMLQSNFMNAVVTSFSAPLQQNSEHGSLSQATASAIRCILSVSPLPAR